MRYTHCTVATATSSLSTATTSPGTAPQHYVSWGKTDATIAFTTLYGFGALFGLIAGASALVSYFVVRRSPTFGYTNVITTTSGGQPFGDLLGAAIRFIPAWAVVSLSLRRSLKSSALLPPPAAGPVMS
jgi:hypothetical protein